jgi:hypothetical protein
MAARHVVIRWLIANQLRAGKLVSKAETLVRTGLAPAARELVLAPGARGIDPVAVCLETGPPLVLVLGPATLALALAVEAPAVQTGRVAAT